MRNYIIFRYIRNVCTEMYSLERDVERSRECSFESLWSVARSKRRRRVSRNRTIALLRRQKVQDRPGLRSLLPQPGSRLGQLLREDQKNHREKLTAKEEGREGEKEKKRSK